MVAEGGASMTPWGPRRVRHRPSWNGVLRDGDRRRRPDEL